MSIVDNLIKEFSSFPGIGRKSAERLAYFLVEPKNSSIAESITQLLETISTKLTYCQKCYGFSEQETCSICSSSRNPKQLCVVQRPKDITVMETTGFSGLYHVLLNERYKADPTLIELEEKLTTINELIIATDMDAKGDLYTQDILKIANKYPTLKTTRLRSGVPLGGFIEFATPDILKNAFKNRVPMK